MIYVTELEAKQAAEIAGLRAEVKKLIQLLDDQLGTPCEQIRHEQEIKQLRAALRLFRSLVKEGGIPRYTIQSGAALNTVIEETVDPVLRAL